MAEYIYGTVEQFDGAMVIMHNTGEQIVRCKDCRFVLNEPDSYYDQSGMERLYTCMRPDGDGDYIRMAVEPDGFCKWGERHEE